MMTEKPVVSRDALCYNRSVTMSRLPDLQFASCSVTSPPACCGSRAGGMYWRRVMRTIPLTQGKVAIVDDQDYAELSKYKWYATNNRKRWYAGRHVGPRSHRKQVFMHRQLLNAPPGLQCDHINGDGLDNRRCNLRICTSSENSMNRRSRGGTSEFKGVYWYKRNKKWRAQIRDDGKQYHLGYFQNEASAARAYNRAARNAFGEFARVNSLTELYAENHND